jgi:hypothetical protein
MNHHFGFITKFIKKQLLDSLWANDYFKGEVSVLGGQK